MSKLEFSELDLKSIAINNFTTDSIIKQYEFIQNNQHYTEILDCCDLDKGVLRLANLSLITILEENFLDIIKNNNLIKFVPASGASSRMFAFLIKYYHFLVDENSEISEKELKEVEYFFNNLEKFSFLNLLPQRIINDYLDFKSKNSEISFNDTNSNITNSNINNSNELNNNLTEKLLCLRYSVLHEILFESNLENVISGLNYSNEAKGNIKFHKLDDLNYSINAFETHILEHINYAINSFFNEKSLETNKENPKNILANDLYNIIKNLIPIEFSVNEDIFKHYISLEQQNTKYEIYNNLSNIIKLKYSNELEIKTLSKIIDSKVFYSKQNKSSNSVAFDENLNLVRKENGEFVTRAGGHGALIFNLQDINQDYIFIKNIDNVTKTSLHHEIFENTINLVGYTKFIKDKVDLYLLFLLKISSNKIIEFKVVEKSKIQEIANFVKSYLLEDFNIDSINFDFKSELEELTKILINILDRPLRVVAVVKNTGEPGGGPFYIDLNDNNKQNSDIFSQFSTKQIIELSQIDMSNENQAKIVKKSKYFNPVFMVLNFTRFDKVKYNLTNYMSDNMAMVVEKNYAAKIIKSYEYPGLWNGAMAYWNTVFLELPNIIFHPVKTVNDLLKEGHLA